MVNELTGALEREDYSAAIGVASQSAGGIDVDALIRRAEKQVYRAKEEHYRTRQQVR